MKISQIAHGESFASAAIAYLETLPDDEVITMQELAERIHRPPPSNGNAYRSLVEYGCKIMMQRKLFVYGNLKAIRALRKKLAL